MKSRHVILTLTTLMSVVIFAQKNETKAAEEELSNGNSQNAATILLKAEYLVFNATNDEKTQFFFTKGNVFLDLANKKIESAKNLSIAVSAYQDLIAVENESGKFKYSAQANASIKEVLKSLEKSALEDAASNKFHDGADKMYYLYEMNKKDTVNLYYSASYYMQSKEYDIALKNYEKLRLLNYSGKRNAYYATEKSNKTEYAFKTQNDRDLSVKEGTYEKPRNAIEPSKKIEILNNLAFIYQEKKDPGNAEVSYKKIIEIDSHNIDAYANLAYLKLDNKKALIEEMSNLGTSPKDMKTYDELKLKKDLEIKSAISYLEKANAIDQKNTEISKLLLNLYRSLDMINEYNALKARS